MNGPPRSLRSLPPEGAGQAPGAALRDRYRANMSHPRNRGVVDWVNAHFKHWSLLPAVVVFVLLTAYPMVNLLHMSVSTIEFRGGRELWSFTPGRNWDALLTDPGLGPTVVNTLLFVIVAVIAEMVLGLALALLVGGMTRGKGLMRTIMIIPILVPPVAIGSMFKLMYNHDFGLFNQILGTVGLGPVSWLGSPSLALWSVVLVDIWHWVPFVFLILFAAVEGLPREVLEAGRVDGATRWQLLWRVTLPLLMPAITVALLFRSILAFKAFDEVFLLTGGGPGTSSELLSLHLYKVFFEQNQLGYGAMLSVFTIVGVLMLLSAARTGAAVKAR
jgi:multiple sugar transport system permease protein